MKWIAFTNSKITTCYDQYGTCVTKESLWTRRYFAMILTVNGSLTCQTFVKTRTSTTIVGEFILLGTVRKLYTYYLLTSPLCSFTHGAHNDVSHISSQINSELLKISDWLTVNKLSLNVEKTKFMVFHNYQRMIANEDIPDLMINDKKIEWVSCFNFLGLTINEFMNWSSHSAKIANKISRTLGIMNRLKRYLPFSALKLMYDSLILSHLQFGITCWGFEWHRIFKLQKRALRIMTNSKYNAHTEPLFKELEMLKVSDIFDVQRMKFWYKFVNKSLPGYFGTMFTFNNELYQIETRG